MEAPGGTMRPTVHDLAKAAGVSLATVDRVLNRRSGVREETRRKVDEAIAAIGYVRDVAAANLAKGRNYTFTFIVPDSDNSFLQMLRAEIQAAKSRGVIERTRIRMIDIPSFDTGALVQAIHEAALDNPAGIALVAIDAPEVRDAVAQVVAAGIPVVTLVSDLTQTGRTHFVGVDNIAAGRTAGSLMGRFLAQRSGQVAIIVGALEVRDHRERVDGFASVLAEGFPGLSLLPVIEGRDDRELVDAQVRKVLQDNPGVIGLYSAGAGNQGLIRALGDIPNSGDICVIAHELSDYSRTALMSGLFDAVLNQDAGHEVRSALRVLKAKADGLEVIAGQEKIRIDIFLKDNLP
jgi:LacI family transcriptional regulator